MIIPLLFYSEANLVFPSEKIAQTVGNSLNVDKEFVEEISREIIVKGKCLSIIYKFKAKYTKSFKKSLSSLYENMKLIVNTIKEFLPNNIKCEWN